MDIQRMLSATETLLCESCSGNAYSTHEVASSASLMAKVGRTNKFENVWKFTGFQHSDMAAPLKLELER
jgi:hypothetical protein